MQRFYKRATQREAGNWAGNGSRGEEFSDPQHVYARDLHVFGEGSLFELLCTVRTACGRRGLARYLLAAPDINETLLRPEAIRELRDRIDLREKIALLGEFEFLESRWETFAEWLASPTLSFHVPLRTAFLITSAPVVAILLIAQATGPALPWIYWLAPVVAFHSVAGLLFRSKPAAEVWVSIFSK